MTTLSSPFAPLWTITVWFNNVSGRWTFVSTRLALSNTVLFPQEMDKSGKTPDALLSESVFQAADIVHKVDSSLPNQAQSLTHERLNNVYKRTKHAHRLA